MIQFKRDQSNKRILIIFKDEKEIVRLTQIPSTITNKYYIIEKIITDISKEFGEEFDNWFETLLSDYQEFNYESELLSMDDIETDELTDNITLDYQRENTKLKVKKTRYDVLYDNIPSIVYYINNYMKIKKFDFSQFVNRSKSNATSIFFDEIDMENILKFSGYLKIYSLFSTSVELKLDQKFHKKIYNKLLEVAIPEDSEVITKIMTIIKTKTYRYNLTDKFMWEFIKTINCKETDDHIIEIFNFIMTNILILSEFDKNPITYFVSVTNESIKWFLRSAYKGSIVYENEISTEDIHSSNINNLMTYAYNDTLGRFKKICANKVYDIIESKSTIYFNEDQRDLEMTEFQNRMSSIEETSPICDILTYPIISHILEIPYEYVKTLKANSDDSTIISIYINYMLNKVFKGEYDDFFKLLMYYPTQEPPEFTTYKIKDVGFFVNHQKEIQNFYNYKTIIIIYHILSNLVGRVSRIAQKNAFTGNKIVGIPLSKIEKEIIIFYSSYFSGGMEEKLNEMKELVLKDF